MSGAKRGRRGVPAPRQTMGSSDADRIVVRGFDLCDELIDELSFTGMVFLEVVGRTPTDAERRLLDAVLVTMTEHGLTPSSISTRLTFTGAPESLQGAVSAGLLGAGNVFLGAMEACARALQELAGPDEEAVRAGVRGFVRDARERGEPIAGIGHPIHREADPRVIRLFAVADACGFGQVHRRCLVDLQEEAERVFGRSLPVNAGGAVAAVLSDAGLPWRSCRGFAVIARAAGLVGHVMDEGERPTGRAMWEILDEKIGYEDPS